MSKVTKSQSEVYVSKCLIIGDPHLKASSMSLAKDFLSWIEKLVTELKPDFVINLGDTFHTHNVIRSEVMALVSNHIEAMASLATYIILVGNHDMAHHKAPEVHAWLPFVGKFPKVKIVDKLFTLNGMAFLPYIDDVAECQATLNQALAKSKFVFCHQTFKGANFGFLEAKDGVVVPDGFDGLIVSGHIHKGQRLGNVWYPGTPFAQEASDADQDKGVYLLDTNSGEVVFFESPLPRWMTYKAGVNNFEQVIETMNKRDRNHVVLMGTSSELSALVDSLRFKELKKEYNFSVRKQPVSQDGGARVARSVSTLEAAVVDYINSIYQGSVDREALKSRCLEALNRG